jgi:hypothetical protein
MMNLGMMNDPIIDRFAIVNSECGRGYGTLILKAILSHYKRLGAETIHIGWLPFNTTPGRRSCRATRFFIQKLGFIPTGMSQFGYLLSRELLQWNPLILRYNYLDNDFLNSQLHN